MAGERAGALRGRRLWRGVAAVVVVALFGGCSSSNGSAAASASASGPGVHGAVHAVEASGLSVPYSGLRLATKVWRLTSDRPVDGDVTVTLPLTSSIPAGDVVVAVTADDPNGPWTPLTAEVDSAGKSVRVHATHFSFFAALFAS